MGPAVSIYRSKNNKSAKSGKIYSVKACTLMSSIHDA